MTAKKLLSIFLWTVAGYIIGTQLTSCNPYVVVTDDKIVASAGFMSKSQAFAGKAKTAHGSSASWSSVGADSTEVPISVSNTALGLGVANSTFKTVNSNNAASSYGKQVDATAASKPTITTNTRPLGGVQTTVTPAPVIPAPPKF